VASERYEPVNSFRPRRKVLQNWANLGETAGVSRAKKPEIFIDKIGRLWLNIKDGAEKHSAPFKIGNRKCNAENGKKGNI